MNNSRRDFLKMGTMAGAGFMLPGASLFAATSVANDDLLTVSYNLLQSWGKGLLALQLNRPGEKTLHGGILCPACATVHGRSGDAVLPLLYLADKTGDKKYLAAAMDVYEWMENTVSAPDGSWLNEINASSWKGTTVFAAIALAESIHHFGHLLNSAIKTRWTNRLHKAADYLYNTFTIQTGNINYPIAGSYALSLCGILLNEKKYTARGRELAHQVLHNFTPNDHLIFGEGHPDPEVSAKGCYSVDLGYNVEESLPSLVLYSKLTNDKEVLDAVTRALTAHMEFMLPDGGWDNSWGTRNFKWTYWGSRTSDGCQPAYALMAHVNPAFYNVALQNTLLMQQCTHNNLLHGGPHYVSHKVAPCVHHTFSHAKALTTLLLKAGSLQRPANALLPRQQAYGVKAFPDINTWLVATGDWRGTITGYDQEYSMKAGHASGGSLSMLWHTKTGPLITASMNRYQMTETFNQQRDDDPRTTCLTPRWEKDGLYTTVNDLKASIDLKQNNGNIVFITKAALVDENQAALPSGAIHCDTEYSFAENEFIIRTKQSGQAATFLLPLIARANEPLKVIAPNKLQLQKKGALVTIEANTDLKLLYGAQERIFNFIPGMEAVPVQLQGNNLEIKIRVS